MAPGKTCFQRDIFLSPVVRQLTILTLKKSRGTGERESASGKQRARVELLLTRKMRRLKTVVEARKKLGVQSGLRFTSCRLEAKRQKDKEKHSPQSTELEKRKLWSCVEHPRLDET